MIVDKRFIPLCHIGLLLLDHIGFIVIFIFIDHIGSFCCDHIGFIYIVITLDLHIVITLDLLILNEWGVEYLTSFLHPSSTTVALGLFAPLVT